jgi:hypothetical protein
LFRNFDVRRLPREGIAHLGRKPRQLQPDNRDAEFLSHR